MNGKLLRKITNKYGVSKEFSNLLYSNYIKGKKIESNDYFPIGITLLSVTKDFPKTMYFLDELNRSNRICYLKNLYIEWNRLDSFVYINQYEKDLYEEDLYLFMSEIEEVFGKQLIDNVLTFYRNYQLYMKIKRDIIFENK